MDTNQNFKKDEKDFHNELHKSDLSSLNVSSEELNDILDHKPNNQFTEPKPKTLFNRFSSFFSNEKSDEKKLEPSLNVESETLSEEKISNLTVKEENIAEISMKTNNFDLFSNKDESVIDNYQINLTDIEQEPKEIDEKVLEIPAFLRRQAN